MRQKVKEIGFSQRQLAPKLSAGSQFSLIALEEYLATLSAEELKTLALYYATREKWQEEAIEQLVNQQIKGEKL